MEGSKNMNDKISDLSSPCSGTKKHHINQHTVIQYEEQQKKERKMFDFSRTKKWKYEPHSVC